MSHCTALPIPEDVILFFYLLFSILEIFVQNIYGIKSKLLFVDYVLKTKNIFKD